MHWQFLLCLAPLFTSRATALDADTLFFAFSGGSVASWDASRCFTVLTPAPGCGPERPVSIDYVDGILYYATASNVFAQFYPAAAPFCGWPLLPADPLRSLLVARAGAGWLYVSDGSRGLFRAPLPAAFPPALPRPAPQLICDARCDGVLGARVSLTVGPAFLYYSYYNVSGNGRGGDNASGVSALALGGAAAVAMFRYAPERRWVPTDLDGPATLPPSSNSTSLWWSEWRQQREALDLGAIGVQWFNVSQRVTYLGGDPRAVPMGGSLAVDVANSALFFSSEVDSLVAVINALERGKPPSNVRAFDFSASGLGVVVDITFVPRGRGSCTLPYAALQSAPAPLTCAQPFPGCSAPPSVSPTPSPSVSAASHPVGGGAAGANSVGIALLLCGVAVVVGGAAFWLRRRAVGLRRLAQVRKPETSGSSGGSCAAEDVESDTAGLSNIQ